MTLIAVAWDTVGVIAGLIALAGAVALPSLWIKHALDGVGSSIDTLRDDVNRRVDDLRSEMGARFDAVDARIGELRNDVRTLQRERSS